MKRVEIDPDRRTIGAAAGLTLGEFDAATNSAFGLGDHNGRQTAIRGMAGLLRSAVGSANLARAYGLACDNLAVGRDRDRRRTSPGHERNRELRPVSGAIRGGGGNFGIATSLTFRLHPIGPRDAARAFVPHSDPGPHCTGRYCAFYRDLACLALPIEGQRRCRHPQSGLQASPSSASTLCYGRPPPREGAGRIRSTAGSRLASGPFRATGRRHFGLTPYLAIQSAGRLAVFPTWAFAITGRRNSCMRLATNSLTCCSITFAFLPHAACALGSFQHVGGAIGARPVRPVQRPT